MNNIIDLHSHTTKSDGSFTPNELLKYAEEKGLKYLSITDHESVEAYYDLNRNLFSGSLIPGVELRTSCFGVAIELLAYNFDIEKMRKNIKKYNYKNVEELDKYMIELAYEQYTNAGVKLDSTFVGDFDRNVYPRLSRYINNAIAKYPENNRFLEDVPEKQSFFRYCITNPNSKLFLNLSSAFPSIEDLINTIKDSGGLVCIPHIFEYKENAEIILQYLLENYDIDIIECFYPSFSTEQTNYLLDICKKHNKYISGGSDFHGTIRSSVDLGSGKENNLYIPEEYIQKWITN